MVRALILRSNRTMKDTKVNDKHDDFSYEKHRYFIISSRVFLRKKGLSFKPYLFYIEGIPEPLDLTNVELKDVGTNKTIPLYIDSSTVYELTSRKLLKVFAGDEIEGVERVILLISLFTLILVLVGLVL